jgi:hypothetical protein
VPDVIVSLPRGWLPPRVFDPRQRHWASPVERRAPIDDVMPPRGAQPGVGVRSKGQKAICATAAGGRLCHRYVTTAATAPGPWPRRSLAILHCGHLYEILIT